MVLLGRIDDPYVVGAPDFSDPRFHGKSVRLEISSPRDPNWLEIVATQQGIAEVCGIVKINTGVEPEQFELDGEMGEDEPVNVILSVSADAFEAIRRQVTEAFDHNRGMMAKLLLAGKFLPESESEFPSINLKDLDVSETRYYAVNAFELFETQYSSP